MSDEISIVKLCANLMLENEDFFVQFLRLYCKELDKKDHSDEASDTPEPRPLVL